MTSRALIPILLLQRGLQLFFKITVTGFALACALAGVLYALSGVARAEAAVVAIRDVRVFDGEQLIERATVVVRDGAIAAVGADEAVPADAQVVDGTGKTLLPGLIDAHTHVFGTAQQDALRYGVTTELDMMNAAAQLPGWRAARESSAASDAADVFSAGYAATAPNGHGTQFGFPVPTLTTAKEAQAFVAERVTEGSDWIKIIVEDGHAYDGGLDFPTLDAASTAALIEAAHAQDRLAAVHVSSLDAAAQVTGQGADGLVHVFADAVADAAFVEQAQAQDLFVIPTLSVISGFSNPENAAALLKDARLGANLSASQKQTLSAEFPFGQDDALRIAMTNVQRLHAAGVDILAGSDAPNPGTAHGASLHHELALLVEAGLTPIDALRAATALPAERFELAGRGRIVPGARADLLLVAGDPSQDITATRDIVGVWKNGQPVERAMAVSAPVAAGETLGPGTVLADFEQAEVAARVGAVSTTTDAIAGGKSVAEIVQMARDGGGQALQVTGSINAGFPYPWSGMMLLPSGGFEKPADVSQAEALVFSLRGERPAMLMIFVGENVQGAPQVQLPIRTTGDWQEIRLPLADHDQHDWTQLRGIIVSAVGGGAFEFQVDDFRLE